LKASSIGSSFGCLAVIDLAATVAVVLPVFRSVGPIALVGLLAEFMAAESVDALFVAGTAAALDAMSGTKRDSADIAANAARVNRLWYLDIWLAPSLAVFHPYYLLYCLREFKRSETA
jgi:hypothetical protein